MKRRLQTLVLWLYRTSQPLTSTKNNATVDVHWDVFYALYFFEYKVIYIFRRGPLVLLVQLKWAMRRPCIAGWATMYRLSRFFRINEFTPFKEYCFAGEPQDHISIGLMFIVSNLFGSIFWGTIISFALTTFIWFAIQRVSSRNLSSPLGYALYFILSIFLAFQSTLTIGAFHAKGYINDLFIHSFRGMTSDISQIADFEELRAKMEIDYPFTKSLLKCINPTSLPEYTEDAETLAAGIAEQCHSILNSYIQRRVLWMIGGIFAIIIISIRQPVALKNNRSRRIQIKGDFRKNRY